MKKLIFVTLIAFSLVSQLCAEDNFINKKEEVAQVQEIDTTLTDFEKGEAMVNGFMTGVVVGFVGMVLYRLVDGYYELDLKNFTVKNL